MEPSKTTTLIGHHERPDWLPRPVWPFPMAALEVDGRRVVVSDSGGPGPVLLFCHVGLWSLLWRDVMLELSGSYRCVTLDPPGSGLSERVGAKEQTIAGAASAVGAVVDALDLSEITLVVHDLGGLAAFAAMSEREERVARVAVANAFAWRPRGVLLPAALGMFGSVIVRELNAAFGWMPKGSSTRFGVGKHLERPAKRAWRRGLADRSRRRATHRLFRDARRSRDIHRAAEAGVEALSDRPLLTIFGQFGDYLGFQRRWRRLRPDVERRTIRRGLHFPMADDPAAFARHLDEWIRRTA